MKNVYILQVPGLNSICTKEWQTNVRTRPGRGPENAENSASVRQEFMVYFNHEFSPLRNVTKSFVAYALEGIGENLLCVC